MNPAFELFSRSLTLSAIGLLLSCATAGVAADQEVPFGGNDQGGVSLLRIQIEVPPSSLDRLSNAPRTYIQATVRDGASHLTNVAVRLKGRTGSFQNLDAKPSFTFDVDRFIPGQRLRGLSRLHLNNSVEDPSYLHEWLGAELFRAAGVPAPRVSHAMVDLNGRRLGLYVVKEGFDDEFLARHFQRTDGNLYEPEPGAGADVTGPMSRSRGSGVADGSDLRRLAAAAAQTNLTERWEQFGALLDTNRFLSFLAMEVLLGHRDGYALARNNYRLYHDPETDRFVFLPSGMDNLLGRASSSLQPRTVGTVANAFLEIPWARRAYRDRLGLLFTNQFRVEALTNTVRLHAAGIARELPSSEAKSLMRESEDVCARIEYRAREIARELALPEPAPLQFQSNVASLTGWRTMGVPMDGMMDETNAVGIQTLHVRSNSRTSSSWRTTVWLAPGHYRFEGRARTRGVKPLPFARTSGVHLSVPGFGAASTAPLTGDVDWTLLNVEFTLSDENRNVELQCHFRAESGEAWFDRDSLRVVRMGP